MLYTVAIKDMFLRDNIFMNKSWSMIIDLLEHIIVILHLRP